MDAWLLAVGTISSLVSPLSSLSFNSLARGSLGVPSGCFLWDALIAARHESSFRCPRYGKTTAGKHVGDIVSVGPPWLWCFNHIYCTNPLDASHQGCRHLVIHISWICLYIGNHGFKTNL
ncbi:unnamed protein product [Arctogadus glacialis]